LSRGSGSIVVASEQFPGYYTENEEQQKYDEGGDEDDYYSEVHLIIFGGAVLSYCTGLYDDWEYVARQPTGNVPGERVLAKSLRIKYSPLNFTGFIVIL
jgi:hypothetical protein